MCLAPEQRAVAVDHQHDDHRVRARVVRVAPHAGHARTQPASPIAVAAPQRAQRGCSRCQCSSATAAASSPPSAWARRGATSRRPATRARRERERPPHSDGVEVGAEHDTARVGPQQDEVGRSGELRSRQLRRHDALAVVAHDTVAARRDRTRRRIGKPLGEPRRVGAPVAQPVELTASERVGRDHPTDGSADRDHALDRDARSATASGTLTSPVRSRRQSRSFCRVIIFM